MQKKSQLFQLLSLLSPSEFSELGEFLSAGYLNSVKKLVDFHKALKPFYPNFDAMRLTPEELFKKIYPEGKPYHDNELRGLMSKFHKAANAFLAFNQLRNDEVLQAKLTTFSLAEKDNYSLFAEKAEHFMQHLLEKKERDLAHYLALFEMNRHLFFHAQTKKQIPGIESLEKTADNLDKFFTLAKLHLAAEQLSRAKSLEEKPRIAFLEAALEEGKRFAKDNPVFSIYLNLIELQLDEQNEAAFSTLKKDFLEHTALLPKEEQNAIYPFLINFANRQGNLGNDMYQQVKFKLFKQWLESGLLLENNKLPNGIFRDMVIHGCEQGEFAWVEQFIKEYQKFIPIQQRVTDIALSKAELMFHQNKFSEAIYELSLLEEKEPDVELLVRRRMIQCAYESYQLSFFKEEALTAKIEAFIRYLNRNHNFSKNVLTAHKEFCKATKMLILAVSLEHKSRDPYIQEIKKLLAPKRTIACRKWLAQKMATL